MQVLPLRKPAQLECLARAWHNVMGVHAHHHCADCAVQTVASHCKRAPCPNLLYGRRGTTAWSVPQCEPRTGRRVCNVSRIATAVGDGHSCACTGRCVNPWQRDPYLGGHGGASLQLRQPVIDLPQIPAPPSPIRPGCTGTHITRRAQASTRSVPPPPRSTVHRTQLTA